MVDAITIGGFNRFEALTFRLLGNANALCFIWLRFSGVLNDFSVMFRSFRDLRHSRGDF